MPFVKAITAAAAVALISASAAVAQDQPKIFAYHSAHNFCPAGLQPVTMDGTICCGVPNQGISYQQALAHAAAKKRHVRRVGQASCPVGTKGCTFN